MPFDPGSSDGRRRKAGRGSRQRRKGARPQSMALYAAAAAVLAGVESRQGSIKGLVYASRFQVAGLGVRSRAGVLAWARPPPQPVSSWPRAEREAAVRAGVRDPALLRGAGRRDRQRRPPTRGEEAAAASGQGDGRGAAGSGRESLLAWTQLRTVHGVALLGRFSEMRVSRPSLSYELRWDENALVSSLLR